MPTSSTGGGGQADEINTALVVTQGLLDIPLAVKPDQLLVQPAACHEDRAELIFRPTRRKKIAWLRWACGGSCRSLPWQAQTGRTSHGCSIRLRKLAVRFNIRKQYPLARRKFFETTGAISAR